MNANQKPPITTLDSILNKSYIIVATSGAVAVGLVAGYVTGDIVGKGLTQLVYTLYDNLPRTQTLNETTAYFILASGAGITAYITTMASAVSAGVLAYKIVKPIVLGKPEQISFNLNNLVKSVKKNWLYAVSGVGLIAVVMGAVATGNYLGEMRKEKTNCIVIPAPPLPQSQKSTRNP